MSIVNVIKRRFKQTAVYWGNPVSDGHGGHTFDAPVEILCRWVDKEQLIREDENRRISSRSLVYTDEVLDVEGRLYLGTLASLTTEQKNNPKKVATSSVIKKKEKSPEYLNATTFYYKYWLTPLLT